MGVADTKDAVGEYFLSKRKLDRIRQPCEGRTVSLEISRRTAAWLLRVGNISGMVCRGGALGKNSACEYAFEGQANQGAGKLRSTVSSFPAVFP